MRLRPLVLLLIIALLLSACSALAPAPATATPLPPTATNTPEPTATFTPPPPTPTDTPVPPTATETLPPSPTPTETASPTPTATATQAKIPFEDAIWVYYIELETGGNIGCGDSAVAFSTNQPKTGNIEQDVTLALQRLLSFKGLYFGEFYNPLSYANMSLKSVDFNENTGNLTVEFEGTYISSRDKCDNGRVRAQVFQTVRQFKEVKGTDIRLNGASFGDRVSNDN